MGGNGIPYGTMLRGYPDNSIGPLTSQGRGIGGNTLVKYTNEFRFPFSENPVVYAMLFAEAGGVWNDTQLMQSLGFPRRNAIDLKRSAGIGFRLYMPMLGVLGYDMGYGFDSTIIDGNQKINSDIKQICIPKGDTICKSIAAASIIAKVIRDFIMKRISSLYPYYSLDKNKGYATPYHKESLRTFGYSPIHRKTFKY